MRRSIILVMSAICAARAWNTAPHQRITKAALDSLPPPSLQGFGVETGPLVEIYCIYPDRFEEMTRFGFVRKSPGPRMPEEIRSYCMRPNGELVHGATGDKDDDLASLVFLIGHIVSSLGATQQAEAAKYAGVLSHFIADSQSPPHAVTAERLERMRPWLFPCGRVKLHSAIENSLPEFSLAGRAPLTAGASIDAAASAILERCYRGMKDNERNLPAMVRAGCRGDERQLDGYRIRAGSNAAAILADALQTAVGLAARAPRN